MNLHFFLKFKQVKNNEIEGLKNSDRMQHAILNAIDQNQNKIKFVTCNQEN